MTSHAVKSYVLPQALAILQKKPDAAIALLRMSALGDVVLWIAVVQAIQKTYPQARITWITSSAVFPLLQGLPRIHFVVLRKGNSWRHYFAYWKKLKNVSYDILLAGQASLRANLIYPLIKATLKIGFSGRKARDAHRWFIQQSVDDKPEHLLDSFMRFAYALGVPLTYQLSWDLPLTVADKQYAKNIAHSVSQLTHALPTQKNTTINTSDSVVADARLTARPWLLVLNPAASKAERMWPVERYIELLQLLHHRYSICCILTGGPGESEMAYVASIADACKDFCSNVCGQTTMHQLAAILQLADVVVAPDTGPLHLANAVGTPTVGLHAVIAAEQTGAYHYHALAVDCYPQAVDKFLKKNIQQVVWGERVHDVRAMDLITVAAVADKVQQAMLQVLASCQSK